MASVWEDIADAVVVRLQALVAAGTMTGIDLANVKRRGSPVWLERNDTVPMILVSPFGVEKYEPCSTEPEPMGSVWITYPIVVATINASDRDPSPGPEILWRQQILETAPKARRDVDTVWRCRVNLGVARGIAALDARGWDYSAIEFLFTATRPVEAV